MLAPQGALEARERAPQGGRTEETDGAPGSSRAGQPDPTMELADLLGQAMRQLRRGTRDALAPLGLSGSQARVVRLLAAGPLRMAAIADGLGVVPRTATDVVDSVEVAGLVGRRADPDDRRSVLVALSPAGRRLIERLDAARLASARQVFGGLSPEQRDQLVELLRALCAPDEPADCLAPATAGTTRGTASADATAVPGASRAEGDRP